MICFLFPDTHRIGRQRVEGAAGSTLDWRGFGPAFKHAVRHGVWFAAANANALPRLHPRSSDILAATMTFHIESAIYLWGIFCMRHCDVLPVPTTGPRCSAGSKRE
jgi:Xaa-Pro aminopeptidase